METNVTISVWDARQLEARISAFAALLHACVQDGASVGFILPFSLQQAEAFWQRKVLAPLRGDGLTLFVAELAGQVVGTVQLDHDTPPNQPHRAEVRKMLVHPDMRRRGIARLLMTALEAKAEALGRTLLTLDTRTGDKAEPLYAGLGYQTAGIIPDFCRDTLTERLDSTTIMYKPLR